MALLDKNCSPVSQKQRDQGLSRHQRSMKNDKRRFRRRNRSKPVVRELSATSLSKTCRHNKGDTPTFWSKYTTRRERSDTPGSSATTENSQSKIPSSDQSDHWHDPRNSTYQWEHWKDRTQERLTKGHWLKSCHNRRKRRQRRLPDKQCEIKAEAS